MPVTREIAIEHAVRAREAGETYAAALENLALRVREEVASSDNLLRHAIDPKTPEARESDRQRLVAVIKSRSALDHAREARERWHKLGCLALDTFGCLADQESGQADGGAA